MKIGITFGAFDLFHAGHALMLKEAREHCDYLIVGLHMDPSVDRNWKNKPVQTVVERETVLRACRYVDQIVMYQTERDLENILKVMRWDVRFVGEDYKHFPITAEWTREKCYYCARQHDYSTTELRRRVKDQTHR